MRAHRDGWGSQLPKAPRGAAGAPGALLAGRWVVTPVPAARGEGAPAVWPSPGQAVGVQPPSEGGTGVAERQDGA